MSQISKFLIYTKASPRNIKSKQIFAISGVKVKFDVYRSHFSERCNTHYRQCHSHSKTVHHKEERNWLCEPKEILYFLGAMGFCTVMFFLRGNRVGRDQVPYCTVHVTDGWDELADILSSWEPCRCRKRPQWVGAYRVEVFKNGHIDMARLIKYM